MKSLHLFVPSHFTPIPPHYVVTPAGSQCKIHSSLITVLVSASGQERQRPKVATAQIKLNMFHP